MVIQRQPLNVKVADLNNMVSIEKRVPPKTFKEKLAHQNDQERELYRQRLKKLRKPETRILDGFLLLHSCKVKLPHEAVHAKLSALNIKDVRCEDLAYFKSMLSVDLAEN